MTVLSDVTDGINALAAAVTNASPLNTATLDQLAPAVLAAQAANSAIDIAITAIDATIYSGPATGVAGILAGGFAPTLATTLQAQLVALQNMTILQVQKAAVGRILFNLEAATG